MSQLTGSEFVAGMELVSGFTLANLSRQLLITRIDNEIAQNGEVGNLLLSLILARGAPDIVSTYANNPDKNLREAVNEVVQEIMDSVDSPNQSEPEPIVISGGILSQNLVLESDKIYIVNGILQVAEQASLTVHSGASILGGEIQVFGEFHVNGSAEGIVDIDNTTIRIGNNSFTDSALISIDYANISNSSVYSPGGEAKYGTLHLTNSRIEDNEDIYLWYPNRDVKISGNVFKNTDISIGISDDITVNIENNLFQGSNIVNWASYGNSRTILEFNSIMEDSKVKLQYTSGGNVEAINNYWGTTDVSVIEGLIYDKNNDLNLRGEISFDPFLLEPHIDTPLL